MPGRERVSARLSWVVLGVLFAAFPMSSSAETELEKLRAIYETSLKKIETDHRTARSGIHAGYKQSLRSLADRYRAAGQLEQMLAVRTEQKRFAADPTIPDLSKTADSETTVARLQANQHTRLADATIAMNRSVVALTDKYVAHLEIRKRRYTIDNYIESALAVKQEIERVRKAAPYTAASFALADSEATEKRAAAGVEPPKAAMPEPEKISGDFSVAWDARRTGGRARVSSRKGARLVALKHTGGNSLSGQTLQCAGGRTLVEGFNAEFTQACKRSNALTLSLSFDTTDMEQSGPTRILGASLDGHSRNVSLCQERERLLLRLRTTSTGGNGMSPEVYLCSIQPGKRYNLLVTYREGELRFYNNGQAIGVQQIKGDFSNWEEYQVLAGNEWKAERPWRGRMYAFTLSSGFTDKPEAVKLTSHQ
ncbi:MAG: hypothetical protein QGH15_15820 [Kiritimatiellia bacterium]|nr:hypothetical protein [Kiritimatiellia bacterium]